MKNKYHIDGDTVHIELQDGMYTLIDLADLEKVKSIDFWYASKAVDTGNYYVLANVRSDADTVRNAKGKTTQSLHRWVMDNPKGMYVDHISHDTLDNRRSTNLRKTTNSQNLQNRKGLNSNNTSGHRGVSWDKSRNKWAVKVKVDGKQIYGGRFEELQDAVDTATALRKKHMPYATN